MDSFAGYDKTLPIDLNGTSNPDLLTEVTFGGLMEYPDGSVPMVAKTNTGRMSPVRGRTMKEYDQQIGELKKENFDLKLRIYFLEERLHQKFGDEDVFKTNIHLKVEVESMKKELEQRNEMLQKASETLNNLTQKYSEELEKQMTVVKQGLENQLEEAEKRAEEAEREKEKFKNFLLELREEIEDKSNNVQHLREECRDLKEELDHRNKALADKDNELGDLSARLEKTLKDLENVAAQAQQTEEELRFELEKERANVVRRDRDMESLSILVKEKTNLDGDTFLEKTHLQDEVEDKTKSLEKMRKKLDEQGRVGQRRETMIGNLEDLLRDKEKERKDLANKVESLKKELQGQKQDRQQLKKGAAILSQKLKEQTKESERLSEELESTKSELDNVRSELHQSNLEKLKEKEQLKRDKNELQDRIGGFQERIANQEAELEKLVKSLGKKEGELEGFKDLLKRAEESLSQSESAVESLQQQLKKERMYRDREQGAQDDLDEKNEEIKQLKKKLKDLEGEMEETECKHRKEVSNYKCEIDDLQSQLNRKEHQYQLKLNELDSVAHKLDITVGTHGAQTLPELKQILEEIRSLKGSVGERNIRIDVNPGSYPHVCSDADNNRPVSGRPPQIPHTSPQSHHASRIPVRKGSGSLSSLPEDHDDLKKLVFELQAQNKNLDNTLKATEETVRVQTQKMKHYKNMLIDNGILPRSMSRSSSDPNLASWSSSLDRQSRQSSQYHSTDNLSRLRSPSPAPSPRKNNLNEDYQNLMKENDKLKSQIDGYKRVLKVFQDRASNSKFNTSEGHDQPQPISAESASCLLDDWLDMLDNFLLDLSQGDQNGHMPVTASTTEVTRLRRGLVQARGAIQSLSQGSVATQEGVVSSTGFHASPDPGDKHHFSNASRSSVSSPSSLPPAKPIDTFASSQFSVQQSDDQSLERLRHYSETMNPGSVSMVSAFSELDNSVFSRTNGPQGGRMKNIPDDSLLFKAPLPKLTLSRVSEASLGEHTLELSIRSENRDISLNDKTSPPAGDNTISIYEKTFSTSFIKGHSPHHRTINESAFESTHILEHEGSSEENLDQDRGWLQYKFDRLQSRLEAMEKLHVMMKNEVEIYRQVADQNKALSDSPLLQHLEELRQTRYNLEKELAEKQKDFEAAEETELLKKDAKIQELAEIIIQLQKQLSDCQNILHEKITIINEKERIITETNIILKKERDNAKTDKHELESYRKKVQALEQELRDNKATEAKITEMMSKLKTALEQYKRREGQLESDVRQHMEVANKYQRAASELELKLRESKEFADQLTDDMEKLKEQISELEDEFKQSKLSEEEYKTMLGESRIKISELSECVRLLNDEAKKKEAEFNELRQELGQYTQIMHEKDSIIENLSMTIREKEEQFKVKEQCVKEQARHLEGQGAINTELSSRLEQQKKLCSDQSLTIDKQTKQIKDLENKLAMLEKSDSSKLVALKDDFEKRLAKKTSDMRKIIQAKEEMEAKLAKCTSELQEAIRKRDKYLHNLKVVYPEYKRKCKDFEDVVEDMKKYRSDWFKYRKQLEEMSDKNRTLQLEISVHETLSSEHPISEGERQHIIVQLLAEIKKLKEIMDVYIERQRKAREEHEKLLEELHAYKKRSQVPEAMDGQPTSERPSPPRDQPDGGSSTKETIIHTVTRDEEHRLNIVESPDTTASSDSGNIDEPDQMGFDGSVTWPRDKDRLSGEFRGVDNLSASLPLKVGSPFSEKDGDISQQTIGSPGSFSVPGPLYKQGITDECLHYNIHDSPRSLARLTQIRIDSDDRTLFAIGMIDHFEKLQKEINESHVILKGMATRVKERLKIFGTIPASEMIKSIEYGILKELSLAAENMRICLDEEKSLISCFWMSELPAPNEKGEFVNKKQLKEIAELKEELSALQGKYRYMCEKMNSASQRLYQTNMQRMLSEEEISRSLQSTTEVISQARHNLEQSQKTRNSPNNSPRSSPRATFKH